MGSGGRPDGHSGPSRDLYCKNSTGASAKIEEYFTPELRTKVARIYQGDYSAFGY